MSAPHRSGCRPGRRSYCGGCRSTLGIENMDELWYDEPVKLFVPMYTPLASIPSVGKSAKSPIVFPPVPWNCTPFQVPVGSEVFERATRIRLFVDVWVNST